jgi:hypothetical protein
MRFCSSAALVLGALIVGCGFVTGHQDHGHGGKQIPLHEQEYVQDPVEELERKWRFEVSSILSTAHCDRKGKTKFSREGLPLFLKIFSPLSCLVLILCISTWIKFAIYNSSIGPNLNTNSS